MDMQKEIFARITEAEQNGDSSILVLKEELKKDPELKDFLEGQGYALRPFYDIRFQGYEVIFKNVTHRLRYECKKEAFMNKVDLLSLFVQGIFTLALLGIFFKMIYPLLFN